MFDCMYVCIVCMCVCLCVCMHTHTHTHTRGIRDGGCKGILKSTRMSVIHGTLHSGVDIVNILGH